MTDPRPLTKTELRRTASARAKQLLREMGVIWDWCEHSHVQGKGPKARRWKTDLFSLFDCVYFDMGESGQNTFDTDRPQLVGVQVTQHNGAARVAKMAGKQQKGEDPEKAEYRRRALWAWLRSGARAEVWDWRERRQGGVVVAVERVVIPLNMGEHSKYTARPVRQRELGSSRLGGRTLVGFDSRAHVNLQQ